MKSRSTPALLVAEQKIFHEVVALLDVEVALLGGGFGVGELDVFAAGHGGAGDGEGDGFVVVFSGGALGGVVGHDEDAPFRVGLEFLEDGADDVFVDGFDGGDFFGVVGGVGGFVGGVDVAADEVVVVEGVDGGLALGGVVGVMVGGDAGGGEVGPAEEVGDAAEEVDGGDHGAGFFEAGLEGGDVGGFALAPEPDVGGFVFLEVSAGEVDVVVFEEIVGAGDEGGEDVAAFAAGHVGFDGLVGDVVGRGGFEAGEVAAPPPSAIGHEVAVGDAGEEGEGGCAGVWGEGFADVIEEDAGFFVADVTGGVVEHDAVDDGDEVAAEDPVELWVEGEAHGGGFEGGAAGMIFGGVVAQEAEGADIGAGGIVGGRGADGAELAV